MKAILVVDMPSRCAECPLHYRKRKEIYRCEVTHQNVSINNKPTWCPLRPLPQKMKHEDEIDYDYGYIDGRNELIDEITGETK